MHPDPFIPASRRSGGPDYQDQQDWLRAPAPPARDADRLTLARILAVLLIAAGFVLGLGAAAITGWDRAEARATGCDRYRGAEMTACLQDRAR